MAKSIMTPEHPEWQAFRDELTRFLAGPLESWESQAPEIVRGAAEAYCTGPEGGGPKSAKPEERYPCKVARWLLSAYGVDVEASLAPYLQAGGQCACAVVQNGQAPG